MCDAENKNSDGCISYCQKSVKLWKYVNKLLYYKKAYMYRYTMHRYMTVTVIFFIKNINVALHV